MAEPKMILELRSWEGERLWSRGLTDFSIPALKEATEAFVTQLHVLSEKMRKEEKEKRAVDPPSEVKE